MMTATGTSGNRALTFSGTWVRTATLRDEPYECIEEPAEFIKQLGAAGLGVDLFSFLQDIADKVPRHAFHFEWEQRAALPLTTFEDWYKRKIDFKVRNKIRKPQKAGVEIRTCTLTDDFVIEIMGIYDESPLIQGRRNWHYRKGFDTMKAMLSTFPERSQFVGAYFRDELIGFIKLVDVTDGANLMHIISKAAHRDKAPTNGLLAKAVEICCERRLGHLHYALWSRRGLGVFKANHGFMPYEVPRYFVPLSRKGAAVLRMGLHQGIRSRLPQTWVDSAVDLRNRLNEFRYRSEAPRHNA
jgi:hypothetical protein